MFLFSFRILNLVTFIISSQILLSDRVFTSKLSPNIANNILLDILNGRAPTTNLNSSITTIISYNKYIHPIGNKGSNNEFDTDESLKIRISLTFNQIISLDDKAQVLTTSSLLYLDWNDPRLSWNSSTYSDVTFITVPASNFWMPDIAVVGTANTNQFIKFEPNQNVIITSNGTTYLTLYLPALSTKCRLHVYKYPFDKQRCNINIGLWMGNNKSFKFILPSNSNSFIDIDESVAHPMWYLTDASADLVFYDHRLRHFNKENPKLLSENILFSIFLRRRPLRFMINSIVSTFVLNFVILLAFSFDFPIQISLCMTSFLNFAITNINISNDIPLQSEYLPLITLYVFMSILFTFIGFLWFIIANALNKRNNLPGYLKKLANLTIRILTFLSLDMKRRKENNFKINKKIESRVADISNTGEINLSSVTASSGDKQTFVEKCRFCDRCEECQSQEDHSKNAIKDKEDHAKNVSALNFLFFLLLFIIILSFNLTVWLLMASD